MKIIHCQIKKTKKTLAFFGTRIKKLYNKIKLAISSRVLGAHKLPRNATGARSEGDAVSARSRLPTCGLLLYHGNVVHILPILCEPGTCCTKLSIDYITNRSVWVCQYFC